MKTFKQVLEDIQPGPAPAEISYKGYTTKNLHHAPDAAKAFQATITRIEKGMLQDNGDVLNALKATDAYMKLNDMHMEQQQNLDSKELEQWLMAHKNAKEALSKIGEFEHHYDYWNAHNSELQFLKANQSLPQEAESVSPDTYKKVLSYTKESIMGNPFQQHLYELENVNESRPSQRHPLEGHDYHKKSDAELRYIVKDAGEAAKSLKGTRSETKYLDQVNDASTVLHFRKQGMPDWYKKKYGHLKEETSLEEAQFWGNKEMAKQAQAASGSTTTMRGRDEKGVYTATLVRKKGESEHKEVSRVYDTKEEVEDVAEAQSAKSGIYQTDVLGAKAYHVKCMEPNCKWESKRFDRIKQAQAAAEKHAKGHFKQGVAEQEEPKNYRPHREDPHAYEKHRQAELDSPKPRRTMSDQEKAERAKQMAADLERIRKKGEQVSAVMAMQDRMHSKMYGPKKEEVEIDEAIDFKKVAAKHMKDLHSKTSTPANKAYAQKMLKRALEAARMKDKEAATKHYMMGEETDLEENETLNKKSHQYKTTMKHAKNPTVQQRMAAHDIKPGAKGYSDRAAMLRDLERTGKIKEELDDGTNS